MAALVFASGTSAAGTCAGDAAIEAAIRGAVGSVLSVSLVTAVCEAPSGLRIDAAIAEPGARIGSPARFRLLHEGRQVGYAIANAQVEARHVRTVRAVGAGALVDAADIREEAGEVGGELFRPLPSMAELIGQRTIRSLSAGDVVSITDVRVPLAVSSGDRVTLIAVARGVEARGVAIAQQSGHVGDVIRLVNPGTRRALRGRITGKAEVEVLHGS